MIDDGWMFGNDDGVQSEELRLIKSNRDVKLVLEMKGIGG